MVKSNGSVSEVETQDVGCGTSNDSFGCLGDL